MDEINNIKSAYSELQIGMETEKNELNATHDSKDRLTDKGFYLKAATVNNLTAKSKEVLKKINVDTQKIDTSFLLPKMEYQLAKLNGRLSESVTFSSKVHKIGDVFIADPPLALDGFLIANEKPGPCIRDLSPTAIEQTETFVPVGHGKARVLGIMDLMLVEQTLSHYEKGEIAHVENVLIGEERERIHQETTTREETIATETKNTEEKENELSSTERYELQVQSQEVIQESLKQDAGVTANMYGAGYNVTAHANVAANSSITETNTSSSNFARDILARPLAATKI